MSSHFIRLLKSLPLIFILAVSSNGQSLPAGVSIHQLDNGLQVIMVENPALPMVGVNVVIKVGSAYESFATSGMSHMLEHLLFNGSTKRTQKQLYDDVKRIGGYNNANTSDYYTNFMMVAPAEHARAAMEIQADMLFNSTLPLKKFEKEKGIVLEEISRTLADPNAQLERNANALLYPGHALSLPTLGTYATIQHMQRDAVNAFYKNNYVPNNMLMSVIGNFNSAEMLALIKQTYGTAKPGLVKHETDERWATGFQRPLSAPDTSRLFYRFYDGASPHLQLFYPLAQLDDPAFFELFDVALQNAQSEFENKLKDQFAGSIQRVGLQSHSSPVGAYLEVDLTLKKTDDIATLSRAITRMVHKISFKLSKGRITSEVAKTRTSFLKNIEKPHMFGIYNANTFAITGIEGVLDSYSAGPLMAAAKKLEQFRVSSMPIRLLQQPSSKSSEKSALQQLSRKIFSNPSSGNQLIIVQNPGSKLLAIHYMFEHKAALQARYGKGASFILHDCFGQRLKSPAIDAQSAHFGLGFKVNDNPYFPMDNIYLDPDFGYIRVEALADDIPGVISFLNRTMQDFKPTEEEFKQALKNRSRAQAMSGRGDKAKTLFNSLYRKIIYTQAPPDTGRMDYKHIQNFAREYFQPGNCIISVVSPEAPDKINEYFSEYTGHGKKIDAAVFSQALITPTSSITIDTVGHGSRAYLFYGFVRQIDPNDIAALQALSLIISDKIIFDIREKQGLAYRISAGISTSGDHALFYISQGTRPENVDKLVPQYPGFFNIKILKGLSDDEVNKSLNKYLGRMMFRRLSSINRAYYLAHSLYFKGDANYDHTYLEALKKINKDDILRVAEKYMHVVHPVSVTVR